MTYFLSGIVALFAIQASGQDAKDARAYRNVEAKRLRHEWKTRKKRLSAQDKKWLKKHPAVFANILLSHHNFCHYP